MKTTITAGVLAFAALMAGTATAGDQPRSDSPGMRADTDGDGRVSRAEATAVGTQRSANWFDRMDRDKDGYVTQDELKQARETRKQRHGEMKEHMSERFKEADANGDGQLSLDEAQAKMPKLAERFTEIDADKDGMLSREELKRAGHGRAKPQN
jgi:Ca2+-binding EF-hand superfamily protein